MGYNTFRRFQSPPPVPSRFEAQAQVPPKLLSPLRGRWDDVVERVPVSSDKVAEMAQRREECWQQSREEQYSRRIGELTGKPYDSRGKARGEMHSDLREAYFALYPEERSQKVQRGLLWGWGE